MPNEIVFRCHKCGSSERINYSDVDPLAAGQALGVSMVEQRFRLRPGSGDELWCGACAYEFASAVVGVSDVTAQSFQEK